VIGSPLKVALRTVELVKSKLFGKFDSDEHPDQVPIY